MTVRPKARFEILKRDGFTCAYCGATPPNVLLEVDHIVPRAEGGTDDDSNLITACERCNRGKGAVPLQQAADAHLRAVSLERQRTLAEQAEAYDTWLRDRREKRKAEVERCAARWRELAQGFVSFSDAGKLSISRFLEHLVTEEVIEAMEIAAIRIPVVTRPEWKPRSRKSQAALLAFDRRFKYFCGICHNKIRRKQGEP